MNNRWTLIIVFCLLSFGLNACSDTQKDNEPLNSTETEVNELNEQEEKKLVIDASEEEGKDNLEEVLSIDIYNNNSITALVNKQNSLQDNYEPDDLVTVDVPTILENPEVNQLRKEAADALKNMFNAALETDIKLYARSGYRSHNTQAMLFENYAKEHGEEAANRYSARPGQSEHQTGLGMDVTSESVNFQLDETFGETAEGKWIQEHAHEFGFIIRYPKNKEEITGYIYEPWHLRYLGIDVATAVYESGLTYEEFLVKEGVIHEINS